MPGVKTSAGTTLQVAASAPATFDAAGYAALAYSAVGEITDMGEFGRVYNLISHNPLATRSTQKRKGSFNEGALNLQLGLDTDDAGQVILKTAVDDDEPVSCKVTTQNGDVYYFQALVMSFVVGVGQVDQITSATCNMELTTNNAGVGIVEVLAA